MSDLPLKNKSSLLELSLLKLKEFKSLELVQEDMLKKQVKNSTRLNSSYSPNNAKTSISLSLQLLFQEDQHPS